MIYIDTSVIAAYYCPEPLSEKVDDFFISHPQPAISSLTVVELFSAIARRRSVKAQWIAVMQAG